MRIDVICSDKLKTLQEAKVDPDIDEFRGKTPAEIRQIIATGLQTDQGTKAIIKWLVKSVYYLLQRLEEKD